MSELNLKKVKSSKSNRSKLGLYGSQSFNENAYDYDYEDEDNDLNGEIIKDGINFIEEKDISEEREKVILQAKEKLFLDKDQTILALIYLEWNLDKLDNWYDDPEGNKVKAGIELSEKTKKKFKDEGVEFWR